MANDQFQIPTTHLQNTTAPEAAASIQAPVYSMESSQRSPEKQPVLYEHLKAIERKIDSYRETAIELDKTRKPDWRQRVVEPLVGVRPLSPIDKYIEKERTIGGAKVFPSVQGAEFWLHKPVEGDVETRDWYFTYPSPSQVPGEVSVIRYQTTPYSLHKIYGGLEYPLSIQETQNFQQAVVRYTQAVREELYPLDDALEDDMLDFEETGAANPYRHTI